MNFPAQLSKPVDSHYGNWECICAGTCLSTAETLISTWGHGQNFICITSSKHGSCAHQNKQQDLCDTAPPNISSLHYNSFLSGVPSSLQFCAEVNSEDRATHEDSCVLLSASTASAQLFLFLPLEKVQRLFFIARRGSLWVIKFKKAATASSRES